MADEVADTLQTTEQTTAVEVCHELTETLAEVELVPGGVAWMVERSAERGRVRSDWPIPPGAVVRVRSNGGPGAAEEAAAQVLRSELIELRHGHPPLYEGVLLFSPPGP